MHHPSTNNILWAVIWVVAGVGSVFLMRYAYKTCKSQTPFEQRARRVVIWYMALFYSWQSCLALHLSGMHSLWIHAVPLLILPMVVVFLLVQTRMGRSVRHH